MSRARRSKDDGLRAFYFHIYEDNWCIGTEPLSANDYGEIYSSCYDEVITSTVCPYTGLTDKNGRKIFEGDVAEAGYYKCKCQVVWDEKCARFICYELQGEQRLVYVDMVDKYGKSALEVIGTIWDKEATP